MLDGLSVWLPCGASARISRVKATMTIINATRIMNIVGDFRLVRITWRRSPVYVITRW